VGKIDFSKTLACLVAYKEDNWVGAFRICLGLLKSTEEAKDNREKAKNSSLANYSFVRVIFKIFIKFEFLKCS